MAKKHDGGNFHKYALPPSLRGWSWHSFSVPHPLYLFFLCLLILELQEATSGSIFTKDGNSESVLSHLPLRFPPRLQWGDLAGRDGSLPNSSIWGRVYLKELSKRLAPRCSSIQALCIIG